MRAFSTISLAASFCNPAGSSGSEACSDFFMGKFLSVLRSLLDISTHSPNSRYAYAQLCTFIFEYRSSLSATSCGRNPLRNVCTASSLTVHGYERSLLTCLRGLRPSLSGSRSHLYIVQRPG